MNDKFDLIVIGAGSGGIATARRAASHGANVAVIEANRLGGTCVNVGCVPKKVMWNAATLAEGFSLAADYGYADTTAAPHSWMGLKTARDAYIERLNGIYQRNLEGDGVEIISGYAQFIDDHTVAVDGQQYTAPHILIATGGRPWVPQIEGAELGLTSDDFFELETCPEKALVIGAGYIAVELAGVLNALGSEVTLLLRKDQLLRQFDTMLGETLAETMRETGVTILTETSISRLQKKHSGHIEAHAASNTLGAFDAVFLAIGRLPNTDAIGLEHTSVQRDEAGFIVTDAFQNTSVSGVYAVGDITGQEPLTPVAIAAGRKLAERLFNQQKGLKQDYALIPTVVFSHPPIGTIGMRETDARAEYGDAVTVYESRFVNMKYALSTHKAPTHIKLICAGENEKIVGLHIIGEGADEMLQGFSVAIKMGATKADFDATVAIHPTASEEIVTLR